MRKLILAGLIGLAGLTAVASTASAHEGIACDRDRGGEFAPRGEYDGRGYREDNQRDERFENRDTAWGVPYRAERFGRFDRFARMRRGERMRQVRFRRGW